MRIPGRVCARSTERFLPNPRRSLTIETGGDIMNQIKTGQLIRALRQSHGLTQLALAQKIGVSDKAVSK